MGARLGVITFSWFLLLGIAGCQHASSWIIKPKIQSVAEFKAYDHNVHSLAISPDKSTLAIGLFFGEIKLWNISDWTYGKSLPPRGSGRRDVTALEYSKEGDWLVSSYIGGKINIWGMPEGRLINAITTVSGPTTNVVIDDIALTENKEVIAVGKESGVIDLWDLETRSIVTSIFNHSTAITQLEFTSDGRYLVSSSWDRKLVVWDYKTQEVVTSLSNDYPILSFSLSPDGKTAATASIGGIHLWDLVDNKLIKSFLVYDEHLKISNGIDIIENPSSMRLVAFSPSGDLIFGQTTLGSKFVWHVADGEVLYEDYSEPPGQGEYTGVFSADGELLIYGGEAGWVTALEIVYP